MGYFSSKLLRSLQVLLDPIAYDQIFDSSLHKPSVKAIPLFADGVEIGSFLNDSVGDIPENFLDSHPKEVASILKSKEKFWKNKEVLNLVRMFLDISLETMNLFTSLEECLDRARNSLSILQSAIDLFKKDTPASYNPTIEKLKDFQAAGDPFSDEFFSQFEDIYKKQAEMWNKLIEEKSRLDTKLKPIKKWRKVSKRILIAIFVVVVILTIIAAAVTAVCVLPALVLPSLAPALVQLGLTPTPVLLGLGAAAGSVLAGLAAAAAVLLGPTPPLWSSYWDKKEKKIRGESGIVSAARGHTLFARIEQQNIHPVVNKIKTDMESLLKISELGVENQEEGLNSAIDEIKKKSKGLLRSIDKLEKKVDASRVIVSWARTEVLKKLEKHEKSDLP